MIHLIDALSCQNENWLFDADCWIESGEWSPTCGALSVSHNGAAGLVDSVTFGLINSFAFLVFDDAALLDLFCLTDLLLIKWLNISVCILGIWQIGGR